MDRSAAPRPGWARFAAQIVPTCVVPDAVAFAGVGLWALSVWLVELAVPQGATARAFALLLFGALTIVWIVGGCLAGAALFYAYEEAAPQVSPGVALLGAVGQPAAVVAWQVTGSAAWLLLLAVLPIRFGLAAAGVTLSAPGSGRAAHGR
ncbi:hypothetical protein ACQEVB_02705 [Pseudonocardia sp. CA-107938]|uniref:hypothetical protein n=1 Tax=Pseudonocardia sp. CA-107938 TaxID=3240021 RepID=UPI003D91814B